MNKQTGEIKAVVDRIDLNPKGLTTQHFLIGIYFGVYVYIEIYLTSIFNSRIFLDAFIARLTAWSLESANILLVHRKTRLCVCIKFCTARSEDCFLLHKRLTFLRTLRYLKKTTETLVE